MFHAYIFVYIFMIILSSTQIFVVFFSRINSNVDLIVPGVELLLKLNITPGNDINHHQLFSLDHLQETFSYFFKKGSAAERPFMDAELFRKIVSGAENLSNPQVCCGKSLL